MAGANIDKIIFSSSAAVYGTPQYLPMDEAHPLEPDNFYGFTKLEIERLLRWYEKLRGFRFAALRYFNAAGYDVDFVGGVQSGWAEFDDPDHEGHSGWHAGGWTDGGLVANIYTWLGSNPADVVLLHIGTNDISDGGTPAETAAEVRDILNEIDKESAA